VVHEQDFVAEAPLEVPESGSVTDDADIERLPVEIVDKRGENGLPAGIQPAIPQQPGTRRGGAIG
jgi:hypothetical protein